jgi:hypothetical protein
MDKDMHQGHEPEHVDLTQIEDQPSARVDPLFERQTDDAQIAAPWFEARLSSDAPVRSPAGTATAFLKIVVAAGLPAAGLAASGWAMGVAGWLTLTLAILIFLVVGTVGLLLILQTKPTPQASGDTGSDDGEGTDDAGTEPRTDCDETDERHGRQALEPQEPTRAHRALQPPRRR